jgi:cell wall-associated NlpC family hydrolase
VIWAKFTAELVGKPYKAGATGPDAFDCMGLVIRTQREMGWKVPKEFEGWTLETYAQRFESDPEAGLAVLERLLDAYCSRIDTHFLKRGDVLIVKIGENGQRIPGVYAGKRQFLTVVKDRKVRIYGADKYFTIEQGWRYGR